MSTMSRVRRSGALLAIAGVAAGAAVAIAAPADQNGLREYDLSGTPDAGVRPTAVGLPRIGQRGTMGAADLANALAKYHDSGLYERDLETVGKAATEYLDARLAARTAPGKTVCRASYRRLASRVDGRVVYSRARRCRVVKPDAPQGKPAIVLDIDETSLSNYSGLQATGFGVFGAGSVINSVTATGTAIKPVLDLYRDARAKGVDVFFVTGRPASINAPTTANLKAVGYDKGWVRIDNKPSNLGTTAFKSQARAKIESQGYTIIANVGDQESDLAGGHAERAFKLPNPFYFIAE